MIGKKALVPNPALKHFEVLIGDWENTGRHPALPGTELHGRTSFEWHEGGAFVIMHSQIEHKDFPDGVAIFGSDNDAKSIYMIYFDERGISRKYDVSLKGKKLKWERIDPKFSQRFTMTFSTDGRKIIGKGEMSQKQGSWEHDLSLTMTRV